MSGPIDFNPLPDSPADHRPVKSVYAGVVENLLLTSLVLAAVVRGPTIAQSPARQKLFQPAAQTHNLLATTLRPATGTPFAQTDWNRADHRRQKGVTAEVVTNNLRRLQQASAAYAPFRQRIWDAPESRQKRNLLQPVYQDALLTLRNAPAGYAPFFNDELDETLSPRKNPVAAQQPANLLTSTLATGAVAAPFFNDEQDEILQARKPFGGSVDQALNLLATTLSSAPVAAPFVQEDWTFASGYNRPVYVNVTTNTLLTLKGAPAGYAAFSQKDWNLAQRAKALLPDVVQNLLPTTLSQPQIAESQDSAPARKEQRPADVNQSLALATAPVVPPFYPVDTTLLPPHINIEQMDVMPIGLLLNTPNIPIVPVQFFNTQRPLRTLDAMLWQQPFTLIPQPDIPVPPSVTPAGKRHEREIRRPILLEYKGKIHEFATQDGADNFLRSITPETIAQVEIKAKRIAKAIVRTGNEFVSQPFVTVRSVQVPTELQQRIEFSSLAQREMLANLVKQRVEFEKEQGRLLDEKAQLILADEEMAMVATIMMMM